VDHFVLILSFIIADFSALVKNFLDKFNSPGLKFTQGGCEDE